MRYEKALRQGPLAPGPLAEWGLFTRYIEVGDDDYANRHVDAFDDGRFVRYDRTHWVDAFGMLADAQATVRSKRKVRWTVLAIEAVEFDAIWEAAGRSAEWALQVAGAQMDRFGQRPPWLRR